MTLGQGQEMAFTLNIDIHVPLLTLLVVCI